jgi:DNA-binding NarL/FixJ family response regulator
MRNNSTRTKQRARVLIADNHPRFAEMCRDILEGEFEVAGVVLDASKLAKSVAELQPDIVIIDMVMPPYVGFDVEAQVKAAMPAAKIIYMTVAADFDTAAEAFRRGAYAYVTKLSFPEDLRIAVRRAIRGELYLSPSVSRQDALERDSLLTDGRWPRGDAKSGIRRARASRRPRTD